MSIKTVTILGCLTLAMLGFGCPPVEDTKIVEKEVLLEYSRVGGIAGFLDNIIIFSNGDVEGETRKGKHTTSLGLEDIQALTVFVKGKHYTKEPPQVEQDVCCDILYVDYYVYDKNQKVRIKEEENIRLLIAKIVEEPLKDIN